LPKQADNVAASVTPPAGLTPSQVPQFVMFGSDDNYYADGIDWLVNTAFAGKTNSDGTPAQLTFFITSGGGTTDNGGVFTPGNVGQTQQQVVSAWQSAYAAGHQVGNHTWDHDMSDSTAGNSYTAAQWQSEVSTSQTFLLNQAGFPACELDGWRFPYLSFDDAGFQTYAAAGFLFDASVEFGYNWWQPPGSTVGYGPGSSESGKYYWWPFTLDSGFPSGNSGFDPTETKGVGAHPGIWEFFSATWNSPDPTTAGVVRTVTGLDYNMWQRIQTNPNDGYDFCATLEYTFQQKYTGNRSPFNVGIHSTIYSPDDPAQDTFFGNTSDVRRAGLQCFIDYLFSGQFPDVRVVGFHKVIDWMRNPVAIH
jgi:peptidoglycan/xylan/chitin deacetylase (PgdA/CDA1 family)